MSTRRAPPLDRFDSPLRKREGVNKWVLPRKDVVGPLASWTFYWDRHDEGVFIGNRGSGKGVHVDQVLWSNARASQMAVMCRDSQGFLFFFKALLRWERIGVATNWLRPGRKEPSKTQEQTETQKKETYKHRFSFQL